LTVGETIIVAAVWPVIGLVPHEPVPHSNTLLVPDKPPVAVKVVEPPVQTVAVPPMLVGAVGWVAQPPTVTVNVAQLVVVALHAPVPFRRTQ